MPPKHGGKRKGAAAVPDRATEPVRPESGVPTCNSTAMPILESLPAADATILAEVRLLGHYPRSLNANGRDTANEKREEEEKLYQRVKRRKNSMDPQCKAFLDAVKNFGGVKEATDAWERAASARPSSAASSAEAGPLWERAASARPTPPGNVATECVAAILRNAKSQDASAEDRKDEAL